MAARMSWGNAGSTYYAVVNERIVALVYFEGEGVGEEGGPGGEPVITEPAWFLVHVDSPGEHFALEASLISEDMPDHELAAATDAALGEATARVEEHLGIEGGSR